MTACQRKLLYRWIALIVASWGLIHGLYWWLNGQLAVNDSIRYFQDEVIKLPLAVPRALDLPLIFIPLGLAFLLLNKLEKLDDFDTMLAWGIGIGILGFITISFGGIPWLVWCTVATSLVIIVVALLEEEGVSSLVEVFGVNAVGILTIWVLDTIVAGFMVGAIHAGMLLAISGGLHYGLIGFGWVAARFGKFFYRTMLTCEDDCITDNTLAATR
jgi:hypothetical protein